MSVRRLVVKEAREWIGTPYHHQGSVKGVGCDCLGLLRGVWRGVVGGEPEVPPPYTPDWGEVRHDELLLQAAMRHLEPRGEMRAGDVLLFRMRAGAVAKHVGLCSSAGDAPRFIHAFSGHAVVENSLSLPWQRRIVGIFAFPHTE